MIDSYSALTSGGAPANNIYVAVGVLGSSVFTAAAGCFVTIEFVIDLDFFELAAPSV
jgi:hypothetical protein